MKDISFFVQKYTALLERPDLHLRKAAKVAAERVLGMSLPLENITVKERTIKFSISSTALTELLLRKTEFDASLQEALREANF